MTSTSIIDDDDVGRLYEEGVIGTGRTEGRFVWEDGQGFDDDVSKKGPQV